MCRFCHALLLRRLARCTPACLLPMLVLCLRCLLFCVCCFCFAPFFPPDRFCPFAGIQRAPGPSLGPDGHGPSISDPASFRPPRPDSSGPDLGRGDGPDATISAPGHNGRRLAGPGPDGAAVHNALGPEASARVATDVLAIAQGVADTQADLEILRNGVSDVAETLEGKIRDMWDHIQAELRSERTLSNSM